MYRLKVLKVVKPGVTEQGLFRDSGRADADQCTRLVYLVNL